MSQPQPVLPEFSDAFIDAIRHTVVVHRVAAVLQARFVGVTGEGALKASEMIVDLVREEYER